MRRVMVRYEVAPDRVEDNERQVRAVFAELERDRPEGIRYATFKLGDGVSFVHIASIETPDGTNPLLGLEAFKAFAASIGERTVSPPTTAQLEEIGSYRMLDE